MKRGGGSTRNRAAGGLRPGPERREELVGSALRAIGSEVEVREVSGRVGEDEREEANAAAGVGGGSILLAVQLKWWALEMLGCRGGLCKQYEECETVKES
jgi:hypothetical protein